MEKLFNLLVIILIVFCSCKTKKLDKKEEDKLKSELSVNALNVSNKSNTLDVLNIDSLKLRNNKLNLKKEIFSKIWRKSDSIRRYSADTGPLEGKDVIIFYTKGIEFEIYDDNARLISIDFNYSNETIVHPKITLNNKTTLNDLSFFKKSFSNRQEYRNEITKLEFHTKIGWDDRIFLVFHNDTLSKLYFSDLP